MYTTARQFLPLAAIIAFHAAALTLLGRADFSPKPAVTEPETMEVALVPPEPLPMEDEPAPPQPALRPKPPEPERPRETPKPEPVRPQTPREEPVPQPEPEPIATKPAPAAITAPPPAPPAPPAPPQPTAPARAESAAPPSGPAGEDAPVTQPSSSAAHLRNPKPAYPLASQRAGEEGTVVLSVYILADGSVGEVNIKRSSGHARLDKAAQDAVRRWKYIPAKRGGVPFAKWFDQPIPFELNEEE